MPIFTRENKSIKVLAVVLIFFVSSTCFASWTIDLSRRESQMKSLATDSSLDVNPPHAQGSMEQNLFERVINSSLPTQDIVILNTAHGFIPATVRVRQGEQYRIYVVNVNKQARNVSFIMDAFNEHDATFYGKVQSFYISPKKNGVYSYESPETSAQGQLIVYPAASPTLNQPALNARVPASE